MLSAGTTIANSWRIESFLGEGGCARVYSVSPVVAGSASGYELVAKVCTLPSGSATSKAFKEQERISNTLYFEYTIYTNLLSMASCAPRHPLKFYGEDHALKVRYLVMERLDMDLVGLSALGGVAASRIGDIGCQILQGLQWFHSKGFLFLDVKPDNFMLRGDEVVFVDFGLVERMNMNKNKPASFAGTPSYCSLAVHNGAAPSAKDELEALGYVLLSIACGGELPWAAGTSFEDTRRIKASTDITALCAAHHCPELAQLIMTCRAMSPSHPPQYTAVRDLLQRMVNRKETVPAAAISKKPAKRALSSAMPAAAPTPAPPVRMQSPRRKTAVAQDDLPPAPPSAREQALRPMPAPARAQRGPFDLSAADEVSAQPSAAPAPFKARSTSPARSSAYPLRSRRAAVEVDAKGMLGNVKLKK